jgi:hypothetical protein
MARQNTWVNEDGLRVGFGTRDTINGDAGEVHTKGLIKQIKVDVNAADLEKGGVVPTSHNMQIPAEAAILSAVLTVNEAFDQAVEVGTKDVAGAAVDKDGLIASAAHALDAVAVGAGAQIETKALVDLYITVEETTTAPTTGRGQLVVEYIINNNDDV